MADNEITKDQLQTVSDYLTGTCNNADLQEDDDMGVFRTYSGRGMYGRECIAMTLPDMSDAFEIAMNLSEALIRADADYELVDAFKSPRTDSMGRGIVLYWTNIAVAEDEDGEDSDDEPEGQEYADALSGS